MKLRYQHLKSGTFWFTYIAVSRLCLLRTRARSDPGAIPGATIGYGGRSATQNTRRANVSSSEGRCMSQRSLATDQSPGGLRWVRTVTPSRIHHRKRRLEPHSVYRRPRRLYSRRARQRAPWPRGRYRRDSTTAHSSDFLTQLEGHRR